MGLTVLGRQVVSFIRDHGGLVKGVRALCREAADVLEYDGVRGMLTVIRRRSCPAFPLQMPVTAGGFPPLVPPREVRPHDAPVDIIVCVHNALDDVRQCLDALLSWTAPPFSLVIVDDGSDAETAAFLAGFAGGQPQTVLLRNENARGYTVAANQGLRAARGAYAVLLNSDTIVTPQWLDRLIMCVASDPGIGMVGPLSNTASWQSVPEIREEDDWAANPLPEGVSVEEMGRLVADWSGRVYPRLPFLNGFCLLIRRELVESIGFLDEETFPRGYGEENDYCLRAVRAGWALAVADDVYVYHSQSRSYSHETRRELAARSGGALARKHGLQAIAAGVEQCRHDRVLHGVRVRIGQLPRRRALLLEGRAAGEGARIAFLLPADTAGGGANVIIGEARAMRRMGVAAELVNLAAFRQGFVAAYPDLDVPVTFSPGREVLAEVCGGFDAVVATSYETAHWLLPLAAQASAPLFGYYVQDYEPFFFPAGSRRAREAAASYRLIPGMVLFTKTEWNRATVAGETGQTAAVVGPSCDVDLFRPRLRREGEWPVRPLRLAAMVRPATERRNPRGTMELLGEIVRRHGSAVEIHLFGVAGDDPQFLELPRDFPFTLHGILSPCGIAALCNEIDVFADLSHFQAMGLTALEAMACGAAVVVPAAGGATSYAVHERNALVVDTEDRGAVLAALTRLLTDHELRAALQRRAVADSAACFPEAAAFNILRALFPGGFRPR
jgi:GT2 family glycosyltransferase